MCYIYIYYSPTVKGLTHCRMLFVYVNVSVPVKATKLLEINRIYII